MDQLSKMIADVSLLLQQAAAAHGDQAVQLTLEAARVKAMSGMLSTTVLLALMLVSFIVSAVFCQRSYVWHKRYDACFDTDREYDYRIEYMDRWQTASFIMMGSLAVGGVFGLIGMMRFSLIEWVGVYRPEVYLAYQVLNKLGG